MSSWNRSPDSNDPAPTLGGREGGVTYTSWTEQEGLPTWLRPFNIDSRSRFTRTPEVLIKARSKGRDSVPEPAVDPVPAVLEQVIPQPALPEAVLPESTLPEPMPTFSAAAGPLEEDEVFIDWTGQSWAARIAAEAVPAPDAVALEAPADVVTGGLPDAEAGALSASGSADAAATLPDSDDAMSTLADAAGDVAAIEVATIAVAAIEAAAPDAVAAEAIIPAMADGAILPEASEQADVLPAIARLGRLILVAPAVPVPMADQDLLPPPVEAQPEVAPEVMAADGPVAEIIEVLPVEAAAEVVAVELVPSEGEATVPDAAATGDCEAPAAAEAIAEAAPAPETIAEAPLAVEAPQAAMIEQAAPSAPALPVATALPLLPAAPLPFLGFGMQLGGSLGWAFNAPAVPAPVAVEEAAPEVLRRQVVAPIEPSPVSDGQYELPPLDLLTEPPPVEPAFEMSEEFLDRNSAVLQQTLRDFGVRGEVIDANPGPVVTLYEFEPAPGTKSSRVIGLSADIARSMSAVSARVAVVEGRNVIGIELPNQKRETVWLRELIANHSFPDARARLGICLGKTIGGEPVIVDLARMPHLLVAGTTGSGKSVAINTMILSLLYRLTPEQCRLIMIDPKMLELSVYEGIPHLLTPVVTDPKKAIIALQWAVREMEDRYRKMARLKVRNIEGFNARVAEAREKGEVITFTIERGFDRETGETVVEEATLDLTPLPYIVIIVDEMADLMMVAGKDIEGAIQRLAQMARAAGIHLVMATQRPSVDVITGTIKANFPTRISFQVTSKIDSRTILGEMGAETLLGQGDMLYMANGGRITRVHGPFVSDGEVENVVAHLKAQGRPEYLDAVTADEEEDDDAEDAAVFDRTAMAAEDGGDHYEQAVAIVLRDRKASTSYIQRRLQVGYNKAASLMERMENEGIVGPANHAGKREILSSRQS